MNRLEGAKRRWGTWQEHTPQNSMMQGLAFQSTLPRPWTGLISSCFKCPKYTIKCNCFFLTNFSQKVVFCSLTGTIACGQRCAFSHVASVSRVLGLTLLHFAARMLKTSVNQRGIIWNYFKLFVLASIIWIIKWLFVEKYCIILTGFFGLFKSWIIWFICGSLQITCRLFVDGLLRLFGVNFGKGRK